MRDYNYKEKWKELLTPEVVKKLTLINEFKGEQRLVVEAHKRTLADLLKSDEIEKIGGGRYTKYVWKAED